MKKLGKLLILFVYLAGFFCVVWLTVGYLHFSNEVVNPNAMLPIMTFEHDALLLLIGAPVMLAACVGVLLVFPKRKLVVKLAVFLPFLVCLAVVGHYLTMGYHPVEAEIKQFIVEVSLETDEPVYAIGMDILVDGEAVSTQVCQNASQNIPLSGTILFSVVPEDVPQGRALEELLLRFTVYEEPTEQVEPGGRAIQNGTVACTQWEETKLLTICGSTAEGYFGNSQ